MNKIPRVATVDMDKAKNYWYMISILSSSRALANQLKIMQELHSVCLFLPPFLMIILRMIDKQVFYLIIGCFP